ncbi:OpgC family protein [Salipiger sp.]|uniref:OpgC family protein n=1 Tax=Salipiger sp. TaxID=2078585 RepID=UPI003A97AC47
MSQPERKLVSFPGAAAVRGQRDPRIDAFRGAALVMILIDHIPGNPYEALTLRNFGFSDAAEAFFVMSGVAAGIAYSGRMERWTNGEGSLREAVTPIWHRAWVLYLVQMVMTVVVLAMFAMAANVFLRPELLQMHNISRIFDQTGAALTGLAALSYHIGYVNILPTYIVLLLLAPLAIRAGLRAPWPTLAVSACIWFVGGWLRLNVPNYPGGGGWFFSPFTWQFIFVLGLTIGIRHRRGERLVPVNRPLFLVAAGFLVLVLAWKFIPPFGVWMNNKMWLLGKLGAPANIVTHDKPFLAFPRLIHAVALVYVVSCLPQLRDWCAHRLAAPLRMLGRQGLAVFAWGSVLALGCQILLKVEPGSALLPWLLPPLAVLAIFGVAAVHERNRTAKRTAATPPARTTGGLVARA